MAKFTRRKLMGEPNSAAALSRRSRPGSPATAWACATKSRPPKPKKGAPRGSALLDSDHDPLRAGRKARGKCEIAKSHPSAL